MGVQAIGALRMVRQIAEKLRVKLVCLCTCVHPVKLWANGGPLFFPDTVTKIH